MSIIPPRYEALFDDLKHHNIGDFLISRDFKLFLSSINFANEWRETVNHAQSSRRVYMTGVNHKRLDSIEAFAALFNGIEQLDELEKLVIRIIERFIHFKNESTDFSDVVESLKITGFASNSIKIIEDAVIIHQAKSFPVKENNFHSKEIPDKLKVDSKKIFLVHGHNGEIKQQLARAIEKLNLIPVILHEQSNEGSTTIIEKFEKNSNVSFAIVLLTYDDFGNSKTKEEGNKRARQNVVFELGYFIGKLGRNRVLAFYEEGVELPSDFSGVLYTKIDSSDSWKFAWVKELNSAGFEVDANKVL